MLDSAKPMDAPKCIDTVDTSLDAYHEMQRQDKRTCKVVYSKLGDNGVGVSVIVPV